MCLHYSAQDFGTFTSGGAEMFTCGAIGCLPPVGQIYLCLTAWGCIPPVVSPTLGGSRFEYTSGGSCGRACIVPPKNWNIYLRCYRHLPAVLKCAYPAGDVYLRWLLHRAWQDACHLENYLRCYRLHGGCVFEYTSGGSCGCACNIPPKSRGHLPPVGQRCLPAVLLVYTSGGFAYTRRE